MEARLKEDILREADRYDGAIMVIHETDNGEIFDAWENVNNEAVLTPLEVYKRWTLKAFQSNMHECLLLMVKPQKVQMLTH
jgi:hypothetical protein